MKYALVAGLLALTGVNGAATSFAMSARAAEPVEHLRRVPDDWTKTGTPSPDHHMDFHISVRSADPSVLERTLMDVSSPASPRYGQYLNRSELEHLLKPRSESVEAVLHWLHASGIPAGDMTQEGEWIKFRAPIKIAEPMMAAKFHNYQSNHRRDVTKVRALSYSVPGHVRRHIDMIHPITRFGQLQPERSLMTSYNSHVKTPVVNETCNIIITPTCLADLYKFADYKVDPTANVTIGVTGYLGYVARYSDLADFTTLFAPTAAAANFTVTSVAGGLTDQNAENSIESNMDIQYTTGLVGPNITTTFFSTAGLGNIIPDLDQPNRTDYQTEPFIDFFTYLLSLENEQLPSVVTTSYGENEQQVGALYANKVCNLIGQLGTRGVSVIFASGDAGPGSACQTNDGRNATRFLPNFPATCPYLTSVGSTSGVQPEIAAHYASGGFSDFWQRPAYQDKAVTHYLKRLGKQWNGLYNPSGRGFPDVAAQGTGFAIVDKGIATVGSGTSLSAPVFASIVALLNNARIAAGMPAMGFLNPWLYEVGHQALNDIVEGGSQGCTGESLHSHLPSRLVPYASWNATQGWDPVTGLGTPDFEKLLCLATDGRSNSTSRRSVAGKV